MIYVMSSVAWFVKYTCSESVKKGLCGELATTSANVMKKVELQNEIEKTMLYLKIIQC